MNFVEFLKKLIPKNSSGYALNLYIPDIVVFERTAIGAGPKLLLYN
jgi:hypothetical protein